MNFALILQPLYACIVHHLTCPGKGVPDCPDACETLPAGLPERSISTMAAVHSVIMGEPVRWFKHILGKICVFSASSPLLLPSFRIRCPDLRPLLWLVLMVSSPDDLSSSSDNVSLPRLFLDLKEKILFQDWELNKHDCFSLQLKQNEDIIIWRVFKIMGLLTLVLVS